MKIAGHTAKTVAGKNGRWEVKITPPAPGAPYTMNITDGGRHVTLHEILVGDVWLCGGQSNMELPLSRTQNGAAVIAAANQQEIRLFKVGFCTSY